MGRCNSFPLDLIFFPRFLPEFVSKEVSIRPSVDAFRSGDDLELECRVVQGRLEEGMEIRYV